mgnify:CR=1 FL=1
MVDSRLDFLNFATEVGKRAKDQAAQVELDMARNRETLANARERADDDTAFATGFGVVRFTALGELATRFGAAFNDPLSQTARDAARAAAGNFLAAFTDKKAENGFVSGMSTLIGLGSQGERARAMMDSRLKHYQEALKNAKLIEDASERKAAMADAQCYTSPARKCPKPDGSCVGDDGKPFTPTHNYVPERVIPVAMGGGKVVNVTLKARGATTRESQLYAYCALVAEYGEAALSVEVADAMLFNGGRWVADTETLSVMANKASDAVNALLATHGGGGDTAFLQLASSILARIAAEGFKSERAAEVVVEEPAPVVVTTPVAEPESSDEGTPRPNVEPDPFQALLDGVPETAMGAALVEAKAPKAGRGRRKAAGGL